MKLYALQYIFEDGSTNFLFLESKEDRDSLFKNYKGFAVIRRRDFEEVSDYED